jgi:hypothetical protein
VILCAGIVIGGLLGATPTATGAPPTGIVVIEVVLAVIALGATLTVIQRVLHVRGQAGRTPPAAGA